MINRFIQSASSFAGDIDGLVLLITLCVGFWFLVAEGVFFFLIFRFSKRDGVKGKYVPGETWKEKRWVSIPHYIILAFDVLIIIAAVRVWVQVKQEMPKPDATVRVIAQQWAWTFVHPGPDLQLDTADDIRILDELHVERDKTYHFELTSKDVLHSFSVPAFRLKQDAVPGRIIRGWFKPTLAGAFDIQCAEMCGLGHAVMPARLYIEDPADHAAWLKKQGAVAANVGAAGGTPSAAPVAPAATQNTGDTTP